MAVAGITYLVLVSRWLLPVRTPVVEDVTDKIRSYIVRVKVTQRATVLLPCILSVWSLRCTLGRVQCV
jgi:hypothetical protein